MMRSIASPPSAADSGHSRSAGQCADERGGGAVVTEDDRRAVAEMLLRTHPCVGVGRGTTVRRAARAEQSNAAGLRLTRRPPGWWIGRDRRGQAYIGTTNGHCESHSMLNVPALLAAAGIAKTPVHYGRGEAIFQQGASCDHVWYIETGDVKLSVLSRAGKEAVVALLGGGDFVGEACLTGQPSHTGTAVAITPSAAVAVAKHDMRRLLRAQPAMSDRFIAHILARNIRIEAELIEHLFHSSEQRLARTLLGLARPTTPSASEHRVLRISQTTLAEMIGTTRSRVNFFLNQFKKRGFIHYDRQGPLTINPSRLAGMLDE
jgi:CRP/FNR family cyclic AMP-dependent transcriptional regulator